MHTHHFFRKFALFHKALGNERRVYTLYVLWMFGPHTGAEPVRTLGIHPAAVSRHLHILLKAGLIVGVRKGMTVLFSINPSSDIIQLMHEIDLLTTAKRGK